MKQKVQRDDSARFERAVRKQDKTKYVFMLFVTGATPNSTRAVLNVKKFCNEHLHGRYRLRILDIYQQPASAQKEQILAAPTLIKCLPLPLRRFVGDMSDVKRLLRGLELQAANST